jgi:hypothetical protein
MCFDLAMTSLEVPDEIVRNWTCIQCGDSEGWQPQSHSDYGWG